VLVDDGSRDPRIAPLLSAFAAEHPGVRVRTQANQGFVAAANAGASAAEPASDLAFLNSDTVVTRGWLAGLRTAMAAHAACRVCCPVTSNGHFLSVPRFAQPNTLPPGWDAERTAAAVRAAAAAMAPVELPSPVGFCMLVRRDAWQECGPFDPAFGVGYGEEFDFGQRVRARGGAIVCAPGVYVWHRGGASFAATPTTTEAQVANMRRLVARWPGYPAEAVAFTRLNPLRPLHERLWDVLLLEREVHVLHVLPRWELEGPLRARVLRLVAATGSLATHTLVVPVPTGPAGVWIDAIDHETGPGWRVAGVLDFERLRPLPGRVSRDARASPRHRRARAHGRRGGESGGSPDTRDRGGSRGHRAMRAHLSRLPARGEAGRAAPDIIASSVGA